MTKLAYCFTNDVLFKMFFTRRQDLLKRLVASLLSITHESIQELTITNPEILPDIIENKLCRLDINMKIDNRITDLEILYSANFRHQEFFFEKKLKCMWFCAIHYLMPI